MRINFRKLFFLTHLLIIISLSNFSSIASPIDKETLNQIMDSPDALKKFDDVLADKSPEERTALCVYFKTRLKDNTPPDNSQQEALMLKELGPWLANLPEAERKKTLQQFREKMSALTPKIHHAVNAVEQSMLSRLDCDGLEAVDISEPSPTITHAESIVVDD